MDEARSLKICIIGSPDSLHTQNRARALAARGHDVAILANDEARLHRIERAVLRFVSRIPKIKGLGTIYGRLQTMRRLEADIFHVQYAAGADAWLAAIAGLRPLAVSAWGGDLLFDEQGNATPLSRRLTGDLLRAADLVTAESQRMLNVVRSMRPEGRVALAHWGIDVGIFRRRDPGDTRARLGIPREAPVLFSPKLLQPFYNIHLILEALPLIARQHPEIRLMIGTFNADPAYRARLADGAAQLGLAANVVFLPPLDVDGVVAVYNIADLAITVPPSDGVPRTLMEAAACGVPSILSELPAYAELVRHEESAYLVPTTAAAIAGAVMRLLQDRALYERLRQNVLALAARSFDQRAETARLESLYLELLDEPRPPRALRADMLLRLLAHFGFRR